MNILNKLFKILPESSFKNKIWCFYHNIFFYKKNNFKIYFKKKHFFVDFNSFGLFLHENFYKDWVCFKGYLKNYNLKKGDIIIDAGAYVGTFTLIASRIVGDEGKVIAFEPDEENYKILLNYIKLNNINNIILIKKGLWSKNTALKFKNDHSGYSSFFFGENEKNIISVPTVTLDSELKKLGIKKVDFLKMDIEGAEIEAIKGSKETLRNNNANLAIASYHVLNGKKTYIELERLLKNLGYKTETSFPQHLTTYATK